MEKNEHHIFYVYNCLKNDEKWDEARKVGEIYDTLMGSKVSYRYALVEWPVWKQASEIVAMADEFRSNRTNRWN